MHETVPVNRRVYGVIEHGSAGKVVLRLTTTPPPVGGAMGVLLWRGELPSGNDVSIDILSDPKLDPALTGPTGASGWTPMLAGESDGSRTLLRVVDWSGGKGVKPALGYIGPSGSTGLVAQPAAFNFNLLKRVDIFTAQTTANGIAAVVFDPPFATVPAKALPSAIPNVLAGPIKAELVAGSLSKTGCQVKVTQLSVVGAVAGVLAGATVNVTAIEA